MTAPEQKTHGIMLHIVALHSVNYAKQESQNSGNRGATSPQEYKQLTPQFIVVGAAAGLSAAVSRLTQVSSVSFGPWAVPRSPQQGQAATGVVLHHTPALLGLSPAPPLAAHCQPLAAVSCQTRNPGRSPTTFLFCDIYIIIF